MAARRLCEGLADGATSRQRRYDRMKRSTASDATKPISAFLYLAAF